MELHQSNKGNENLKGEWPQAVSVVLCHMDSWHYNSFLKFFFKKKNHHKRDLKKDRSSYAPIGVEKGCGNFSKLHGSRQNVVHMLHPYTSLPLPSWSHLPPPPLLQSFCSFIAGFLTQKPWDAYTSCWQWIWHCAEAFFKCSGMLLSIGGGDEETIWKKPTLPPPQKKPTGIQQTDNSIIWILRKTCLVTKLCLFFSSVHQCTLYSNRNKNGYYSHRLFTWLFHFV